MPRPRGPQSADSSVVIAVRCPMHLAQEVYDAAGAASGPGLAEHLRNVLRHSVRIPLDKKAGYEEGKMQGWRDANERFRAALKGA